MQVPEDYNPVEHLQSVYRLTLNIQVREEFSDVAELEEIADLARLTGRQSLYLACTHRDDDTDSMTQMRTDLFYFYLRKAQDLQTPVYGVPVTSFQESRRFKPQVHLHFREPISQVEPGFFPVRGDISIRLMNETAETLTMSEATNLGQKIKTIFGTGTGFNWRKGKTMYSYTDKKRGYQLQLLCRDDSSARLLIEAVLDIQGHAPDWKLLNENANAEPSVRYPTMPPTETILGKPHRMPRDRPVADCHFRAALLHIHGLPQPIVLYDKGGEYAKSLVA